MRASPYSRISGLDLMPSYLAGSIIDYYWAAQPGMLRPLPISWRMEYLDSMVVAADSLQTTEES